MKPSDNVFSLVLLILIYVAIGIGVAMGIPQYFASGKDLHVIGRIVFLCYWVYWAGIMINEFWKDRHDH